MYFGKALTYAKFRECKCFPNFYMSLAIFDII